MENKLLFQTLMMNAGEQNKGSYLVHKHIYTANTHTHTQILTSLSNKSLPTVKEKFKKQNVIACCQKRWRDKARGLLGM